MKRVIVTGARGFIGRHTLHSLAAQHYEVHAVDIQTAREEWPGVIWHGIDLLNPGQVEELCATVQATHLLHFAWYAAPGKYWTAPENVRWVQATLELAQAFVRYGGQRLVAAGTCAEYDWSYGLCSEQTTPLAPATLYGTCKHAVRLVLEAFARRVNLSAAWGRIFFLYGPHENPARLVPSVISSLLKRQPARCTHGLQVRDWMYVEDVAAAFVALLNSDVQGPVNVASGKAIRLSELIDQIAVKLAGRELVQLGALPTPDEPAQIVADVQRLSQEIKWRPQFDLDAGLDRTIEWWRAA